LTISKDPVMIVFRILSWKYSSKVPMHITLQIEVSLWSSSPKMLCFWVRIKNWNVMSTMWKMWNVMWIIFQI